MKTHTNIEDAIVEAMKRAYTDTNSALEYSVYKTDAGKYAVSQDTAGSYSEGDICGFESLGSEAVAEEDLDLDAIEEAAAQKALDIKRDNIERDYIRREQS